MRRKQCRVRFSLVRKNQNLPEKLHENCGEKTFENGLGPCESVEGGGTERLKLRRQVAAAAGKKESVSLSLFIEVKNSEVEE